eukprot:37761-Eustigmatos_ZCMA.PRE.1
MPQCSYSLRQCNSASSCPHPRPPSSPCALRCSNPVATPWLWDDVMRMQAEADEPIISARLHPRFRWDGKGKGGSE